MISPNEGIKQQGCPKPVLIGAGRARLENYRRGNALRKCGHFVFGRRRLRTGLLRPFDSVSPYQKLSFPTPGWTVFQRAPARSLKAALLISPWTRCTRDHRELVKQAISVIADRISTLQRHSRTHLQLVLGSSSFCLSCIPRACDRCCGRKKAPGAPRLLSRWSSGGINTSGQPGRRSGS